MERTAPILVTIILFTMGLPLAALTASKEGTYACGRQPKQVLFSPDSQTIVLPLLDDEGFQVIDMQDRQHPRCIRPPRAEKRGFAEGLFIPEKHSFLVSQMTTARLYEYDYPSFTLKREIATGGTWSKFIAWSSEKQVLAVSNWVSNNVSIIDYESGKVLRTIQTKAAPRGMAFTEQGKSLIVLCFDGGEIQQFETDSGRQLQSLAVSRSAMRHIAVNAEESRAYISDMYHAVIYELDLGAWTIRNTWKVFNNPNTIALYQDRWLFVSSRGPNNPQDYTKRSPKNGVITVIDTHDGSVVQRIAGGNQPTGLALSPDGSWLCFSDFQDADIQLYRLTP